MHSSPLLSTPVSWLRSARDVVRNTYVRGFAEATVPVIVYQMGKVGSGSISYSLLGHGIRPIHHAHQLNPDHIRRLNEQRADRGLDGYEKDQVNIQLHEDIIAPRKRSRYITLVRDPVSRNLSAFFENLDRWLSISPYDEIPETDALLEYFLEVYDHDVPLTWFDREPKRTLGIDVFASEFSTDRDYAQYDNGPFSLLLMKCELPDATKEDAVHDFIGLSDFSIRRRNVGSQKWYADAYKAAKTSTLPVSYVDRLCDTDFTRHFYTTEEIEQIYDRWT